MSDQALVWFRNDLRLGDNPALAAATARHARVRAIYVIETDDGLRPMGAAARAWLTESLRKLSPTLAEIGIALEVVEGASAIVIPEAAQDCAAVYWNRRYGPAEREHDAAIKADLKARDIGAESFNARLLIEPWAIATQAGKPFSVFTPFWKALQQKDIPGPAEAPAGGKAIAPPRLALEQHPEWAKRMLSHWTIGEAAAREALDRFLEERLADYAQGRDIPGREETSLLSPHLRFGEIGPRQIWHAVRAHINKRPALAAAGEKFLSELAWRDFSHNLLYHREDIARFPMQARFNDIEWREDAVALNAWRRGRTGIPIVDAGMRQLWATGWMHNRIRMLTASLLAKNLLIDWRSGERWFWDTLVDGDPANNPASWQWVAGCGADAAPYFRIFNPVTQGRKFDPEGHYVKTWVPELAQMEGKHIHAPWEASEDALKAAGIILGKTYPHPIVDLKATRERALEALSG